MPFVAVTSVKLGVTVRPPDTGLSRVTVNVMAPPSLPFASSIVTAGGLSSSTIVAVAEDVATVSEVPETVRPTVKVSSDSRRVSSVVATVKVCDSSAAPAKVSAAVFSV